jgi:4a-hydroxytetrahydrobiopterin dehydratase
MAQKLTEAEHAALRSSLPEWKPVEGRDAIRREFRFKNFSQAWGFMARVALLAEQHDHHPDWSNVWATVRIELSTHDSGGVTEKDVALARAIDALMA